MINKNLETLLTTFMTVGALSVFGIGNADAAVLGDTLQIDDFSFSGNSTAQIVKSINANLSNNKTIYDIGVSLGNSTLINAAINNVADQLGINITEAQSILQQPNCGVTSCSNYSLFSSVVGSNSSILGGYRALNITDFSSTNSSNNAEAVVSGGSLFYSNDTGVNSKLAVIYDGNNNKTFDANGNLNFDLTNSQKLTGIWVQVVSTDLGVDVGIDIYDDNGSLFSATTTNGISLTTLDNGDKGYYFDFVNDFGGNLNDFTNINALRMTLTGQPAADSEIRFLAASMITEETPTPTNIPESNLSWLTLATLSGLGAISFKRKINF